MNIIQEWHRNELEKANEEGLHQPFEEEYLFYKAVQDGNIEFIKDNIATQSFRNESGKGILSTNKLQNIKYHFVVATSLITRTTVMAGMPQEQAYRMSDYYILKADNAKSIDEVCNIHGQMVLDFTQKMHDFKSSKVISKAVHNAIEYIYGNLHNKITVEEIAHEVELSPSHLSRLFKAETGISLSDYIRNQKIEQAKNLLKYSNYSYVEIANYLAFVSQSHFIKTFKDITGLTPKKYRDQYYQSNW